MTATTYEEDCLGERFDLVIVVGGGGFVSGERLGSGEGGEVGEEVEEVAVADLGGDEDVTLL